MDILSKGGKFYARCAIHNWFFRGLPPMTSGCADCWMAYYFSIGAQKPEKLGQFVAETEEVLAHAAENPAELDEVKFYRHPKIEIEKEN